MAEFLSLHRRKQEIAGILLIAWSIFSILALLEGAAGLAGEAAADFYKFFLGEAAVTLPAVFLLLGYKLIRGIEFENARARYSGFILAYLSALTIFHINQGYSRQFTRGLMGEGGGIAGGSLSSFFLAFFGYSGSQVILLSLTFIGVLLFFDIFLLEFLRQVGSSLENLYGKGWGTIRAFFDEKYLSFLPLPTGKKSKKEEKKLTSDNESNPAITSGEFEDEELSVNISGRDEPSSDNSEKSSLENINGENKTDDIEDNWEDMIEDYTGDTGSYKVPPLDLLTEQQKASQDITNSSGQLEKTLSNFGVEAEVTEVTKGPTLTRYEVQPQTGVKVSKIVNLADDIALSLAAEDVRIEAPIPGKSAVGIEIPHQGSSLVRLHGVLSSKAFDLEKNDSLYIGLGRAIDGNTVIADLTEMPHLLIAGATGSGKSVCINSIIASLLFQYSPKDLKMLLIDPKKVELVNYKKLPHLFAPLVTDCQKAAGTLKLIVEEMEKRYDLFAETGTRGIDSYNKQAEEELPYIVVVIDELSDLMMAAAGEVEDAICRLAQMSRAAGIHLVIATQRPSVDVITGLIKANIPSRIAFAVSSNTDSRTILDESGAEKLLGDGDMLFYPVDAKKPHRVQGSYISNDEINRLVTFVKRQTDPEFCVDEDEFEDLDLEDFDSEEDELLEDAIKLVVEYRASISMLQRRLHIGHSRAARLIDRMEEMGIVGPYNGPQPREVLIDEEDLNKFINVENSSEEARQD